MRVRSQSCSEGSDKNYPRSHGFKSVRSSSRDVGITCSVVTREVGVSPQHPRLRNAKTNTPTVLALLSMSGVKSEDIPPDDSLNVPADRPLSRAPTKLVKISPVSTINIDPVLKPAITKTSATNTDLLKNQVYSDVEMEHSINKAIQIYEETFNNSLHRKDNRDVGVQVEKEAQIEPVLMIVERRDVAVQFEDDRFRQEASCQTVELSRRLVEVGVSVKPRYVEAAIEVRPKTRDFGTSDNTINNTVCDKCKVKKRSVGVGHHYFTNLVPEDEALVSLSNIGILQNKPPDYSSPPAKKATATRSVGCGTPSISIVSQGTDTDDLNVGRSHSFGVNTTKKKLVDAAVGDGMRRRSSGSGVFVCDKCDMEIQNVAKNMLTKNSDSANSSPSVNVAVTSPTTNALKTSSSVTNSRIHRPATARSATSATVTTTAQPQATGNEKRRIQRQSTYTKLKVDAENRPSTPTRTQEKSGYSSSNCFTFYLHHLPWYCTHLKIFSTFVIINWHTFTSDRHRATW